MSDDVHTVDTAAKLVRMANQIARNLTHDKQPVAAIADHIHAFWTLRMKEQLFAHGPEGLDPLAAAAIERLMPSCGDSDSSPLPFRGGAGGGGSPDSSASGESPHPNPSPEGEGLDKHGVPTPHRAAETDERRHGSDAG